MASVLAMDELLLGVNTETGRALDLRSVEVCPWLAGDDRVAVRAAVEAVHTPPPPPPTPPPPAPVTVADIAELVQFKRLDAEMAAKRAALPLPRTIADASWYTNQSAMFAVYPGRLTEETAAEIPAYRRLVQQAQKDYARPLDEETLRYVLADIGGRVGLPVGELMPMTVDEFGRMWDAAVLPASPTPAPVPPPAPAPIAEPSPATPAAEGKLHLASQKAWGLYLSATGPGSVLGSDPTDEEVYDWLKGKGEEVPDKFDTFARYLTRARKHHRQPKTTPKAGRETGGSVVNRRDT